MRYIYTMEYYSAIKRNGAGSLAVMWMDLQPVTQSEISQTQINAARYHLYVQSKKMVQMKLFKNRNRLTDFENKLMVTKRNRGRGINQESGINIYTLLLPLLSRFSLVRLCATPQTAAHQAPPSLGFSRQEHWSGVPSPFPMRESEK